ncbi:hypothetical protein NBRC116599_44090 [Aquicoccus sp. SU-CL01552]
MVAFSTRKDSRKRQQCKGPQETNPTGRRSRLPIGMEKVCVVGGVTGSNLHTKKSRTGN